MGANDSSEGAGVQEGGDAKGGEAGRAADPRAEGAGAAEDAGRGRSNRGACGCLLGIMLIFALTTALMIWAGARRQRALELLEKGRAAMRAGDATAADPLLGEAIDLLPGADRPAALYERAAAKATRGDAAGAEALAREAVRLDPRVRPVAEVAARIPLALRAVARDRLLAATAGAAFAGFRRKAEWCFEGDGPLREWWTFRIGGGGSAEARIEDLAALLSEANPGRAGRLTIDAFTTSGGDPDRPVYGGRTVQSWDAAGRREPVRVIKAGDPEIDGDEDQPAREEAYCRDLGYRPLSLLWYTVRHFPEGGRRAARLCTAIGAASADEIVEHYRERLDLDYDGDHEEWTMRPAAFEGERVEVLRAVVQRCRAERRASFLGLSGGIAEVARVAELVAKEKGVRVE